MIGNGHEGVSRRAPGRLSGKSVDALARLAGVACIVAMLVSYVFMFDHLQNETERSVLAFLVLSVAPVALMFLAMFRKEPDTFANIGLITFMVNVLVPLAVAVASIIAGAFLWFIVPMVPFEQTILYWGLSYFWPTLVGAGLMGLLSSL